MFYFCRLDGGVSQSNPANALTVQERANQTACMLGEPDRSNFPCPKMEDKIIVAVGNHPVLYDQSLFTDRDTNRRSQAWREVAETVGESEEVCRTKWKSLRDRFRKEKAKKEAKRSGAGSSGGYKPWRFTAVMGFLTPFLIDREMSSNVPRQTLPPSNLVPEAESQLESQLESLPSVSQPADSQQAEARETAQEEEVIVEDRGKRRRGREMSSFEKGLMSAISPLFVPPPPPVVVEDEDELFFRSLLPAMRRLSIAKRTSVRFQIYTYIFEAEQEMENN